MPKVGLLIFPLWTPHFVIWTPHSGWTPRLNYTVVLNDDDNEVDGTMIFQWSVNVSGPR